MRKTKPQPQKQKGEIVMEIIELDMVEYLGRGIKVYFKDGRAPINFKPMQYKSSVDGDFWIGTNDEGVEKAIARQEIEFVRS